jgi:hypothetical protein
VIQAGYLLQGMALRTVLVIAGAIGCNNGRILAEERLLGAPGAYAAYLGAGPVEAAARRGAGAGATAFRWLVRPRLVRRAPER